MKIDFKAIVESVMDIEESSNNPNFKKYAKVIKSIKGYTSRGGRGTSSRWYDLVDRADDVFNQSKDLPGFQDFCNANKLPFKFDGADFLA